MIGAILSLLAGAFKALGIVLGLAQQNKDEEVGAQIQKGVDAQAELAVAQKAVEARDAVQPVVREPDGSWRLPDNQTDPNCRDEPSLPSH